MINLWSLATEGCTRENGKLLVLLTRFFRQANTKDIKDGMGVMFWPDGTKYEGTFHNDLPHGYGRKIFANGEYYEGHFLEGKANGQGTF